MKTDWKPGDIVEYCNEQYVIIKNFGESGIVKESCPNGDTCNNFHWEAYGEKCKLIQRA